MKLPAEKKVDAASRHAGSESARNVSVLNQPYPGTSAPYLFYQAFMAWAVEYHHSNIFHRLPFGLCHSGEVLAHRRFDVNFTRRFRACGYFIHVKYVARIIHRTALGYGHHADRAWQSHGCQSSAIDRIYGYIDLRLGVRFPIARYRAWALRPFLPPL